jgi:argininosuccinate synthase
MKSRGVYETPAGTVLHAALRDLECITLDKETLHYKELIAPRYAELVYNGQWYSELRSSFDAFINHAMRNTTGTVKLKLYKGNCLAVARKSEYSLYDENIATFSKDAVYNQKDAEGFINLFGLSTKVGGILKRAKKIK